MEKRLSGVIMVVFNEVVFIGGVGSHYYVEKKIYKVL